MSRVVGVCVHPARDVGVPLRALREWAARTGADLVQVGSGPQPEVAPEGDAAECELVVAIGGDGTALAALRAAASSGTPVLGVAYGSLGALTTVSPDDLVDALERFGDGRWRPVTRPALAAEVGDGATRLAYNDLALMRRGEGQIRTTVSLDGTLYARLAGDGCVVSTPVGSSGYSLAAGGPLLTPDSAAMLMTPLPTHGGSVPALVTGANSSLEFEIAGGFGGVRLELDGKAAAEGFSRLTVRLRPDSVTLVGFEQPEPFLSGLRRRGVIADSPRLLAEDSRRGREA